MFFYIISLKFRMQTKSQNQNKASKIRKPFDKSVHPIYY